MAKAQAAKKARVVRCRAISPGWAPVDPGGRRRMIKRGAVINWLQETSTSDDPQKARDGYLRLPTWLEPVKAPVKEEPARNDGPATMSEMQKLGGGIRRGPEGSE